MHAIGTARAWAQTHHLQVPVREVLHDQRFWLVVVVALMVAVLLLALFVEVDPAALHPPHPYLDTYMMY